MKLKVDTADISEDKGIVYLLEVHLDNKVVWKIGVTARDKIEHRVCEILTSIFYKYREFPYCRPKRFRATTNMFEKETILHRYFKDRQYIPEHKFGGSTEFFDVPMDEIVEVYEKVLKGEPLDEPSCGDKA